MEKEIEIPEGVTVETEGMKVTVKGKKGEITRDFSDPRFIGLLTIEKNDKLIVKPANTKRKTKSIAGTIQGHINNMMIGVTSGFEYKMKIMYTHFPMTVEVKDGNILVKNFLGEKGVRKANVVGDTEVKATKDSVILSGVSKEEVSQTAANIEMACKIGKRDRRVFQDGIYIEEKGVAKGVQEKKEK